MREETRYYCELCGEEITQKREIEARLKGGYKFYQIKIENNGELYGTTVSKKYCRKCEVKLLRALADEIEKGLKPTE